MKEWTEYTKSKSSSGASEKNEPKISEYILIKLTDNFLAISVAALCLIFGYTGLFSSISTANGSWALHAAELCLGVYLGLLKKNSGGR